MGLCLVAGHELIEHEGSEIVVRQSGRVEVWTAWGREFLFELPVAADRQLVETALRVYEIGRQRGIAQQAAKSRPEIRIRVSA